MFYFRGYKLTCLSSIINLPTNCSCEDSYGWFVNDINNRSFSSTRTCSVLRLQESEQDWHNCGWFKDATLKHAYMMWICLTGCPQKLDWFLGECLFPLLVAYAICRIKQENTSSLDVLALLKFGIRLWQDLVSAPFCFNLRMLLLIG